MAVPEDAHGSRYRTHANVASRSTAGAVERWLVGPFGVEHVIDLAHRSGNEARMRIALAVEGLRPSVDDEGDVRLADAGGVVRASYGGLDVRDANDARVPSWFEVDHNTVSIVVDDRGATYPLTVDPLLSAVEATFQLAGSTVGLEDFGRGVAISGDGATAAVGAPLANVTAVYSQEGNVSLYRRVGSTWTFVTSVSDPGLQSGQNFGASVALSDDGSVLVVGASGANNANGTNTGSAYVYALSGGVWSFVVELIHISGASGDAFGADVAMTGDAQRILVGAPYDDAAYADAGTVQVYVRSGSTYVYEASMVGASYLGGDRFGTSVAVDATGTVVVAGAPGDDTASGVDAGTARVMVRSGTTWSEEATIVQPSAAASDSFGYSVDLSDDGNTAIVGSPNDDVATTANAGSAFVFTRGGGLWPLQGTLPVATPITNTNVGWSVSLSGDASLAIAASPSGTSSQGAGTGVVRVYRRVTGTWTQQVAVGPNGTTSTVDFGVSTDVSTTGRRLLVGSDQEAAASGGNPGAARVFTLLEVDGTSCFAAADCSSGYCVDGVCCNSSCGGGVPDCQACSLPAGGTTAGTCTPLDPAIASSTPCRSAAGPCDVVDYCQVASTSCPADAVRVAGFLCRAATDDCDVAETCDGSNGSCPADGFAPSGQLCRPSTGACDLAESCTGAGPACPVDARAAQGTVCRASVGGCDLAEACDGSSVACPANTIQPYGVVCRASAGPCDVPESCDGASAGCPTDNVELPGVTCRASAGACDAAEACDGFSALCPNDVLRGSSTVCRASATLCDVAERCSGTSVDCPLDASAPDGTSCDDGLACTVSSACISGACSPTLQVDCSDGDSCTTDSCAEPIGCSHVAVPACVVDSGIVDVGVVDSGGSMDSGATDVGGADVGGPDVGVGAPAPSSCGCRIAGGTGSSTLPPTATVAFVALAALAHLRAARRRRA